MIDIQRRFVKECDRAKQKCADYVGKVGSVGEHVTSATFRNLAVLQGIEVEVRSLLLNFQGANGRQIKALRAIANDEVSAVMQYAVDFKKVCPKQEPGVEGGYSEAELEEIETLVNGQVEEARSIQEEWNAEIEQLAALQEKSLDSHAEFTAIYEQTVQTVAMSEGLGQKYGAPRRRAQERIRSEVVRDEQSAGKIDEMLAKLEFLCDEVKLASEAAADGDAESVLQGSVAQTRTRITACADAEAAGGVALLCSNTAAQPSRLSGDRRDRRYPRASPITNRISCRKRPNGSCRPPRG